MNATAAIAASFLKGEILTIRTAFSHFGVSNLGREVGRSIERKFNVRISKVKCTGKSRYGIECWWYQYRLNKDDPANLEGIQAMQEYVDRHLPKKRKLQTEQLPLL